jgi:hypothetical protein
MNDFGGGYPGPTPGYGMGRGVDPASLEKAKMLIRLAGALLGMEEFQGMLAGMGGGMGGGMPAGPSAQGPTGGGGMPLPPGYGGGY